MIFFWIEANKRGRRELPGTMLSTCCQYYKQHRYESPKKSMTAKENLIYFRFIGFLISRTDLYKFWIALNYYYFLSIHICWHDLSSASHLCDTFGFNIIKFWGTDFFVGIRTRCLKDWYSRIGKKI